MTKFKSYNKEKNEETVDKKAFLFGLMSVFLCGMGFSIISPVVPFLVEPYVSNASEQAFFVTLLTSVYAICVFFVAPGLGALSDRYGRRPILLICLLGSSIGYLIFGIGGSIWVLFLGRIIDGVTGGSISTIFAYFADITPKEERTKYFGWISAIAGIGAAIGPTLGGLLAKFGYAVPMYFGAIITLLNFIYGILYMPESLNENNRLKKITLVRLNPFTQLMSVLSMKTLKRLLISAFLIWIPNGSLQSIFSLFTMDTFNWTPTLIGLMFSIMGIQDIISQGLIMPKLLMKLSDVKIAILGMVSEIIGYALIAASAIFTFYPFFIVGMFIFGFGDSIFGPSFNGMLSKSADSSEQGRIQGGSQALQSLARIIGPILGGQIYVSLGHSSPAFMGVILIILAIPILYKSIR
ncbi:MFS transporter [Clostridium perfringens]|uniref:MFS transporter n=1 Tax=Clostridium perfringens TaxID=1502 RepID=UPI002246E29F|nr:MFS transporter [Clostridium perfringens]MCX0357646.1 MFS transporter [Clostridium perfringens]MCX0407458.1 MFS transporter [Clostridium perfringens]MCX0419285.1 MFS transporter [Clostridium perfringens]WEV14130.1 MFS transporter [Clostridium perfringens D]